MKKNRRVLEGFRYESLDAKIRYMLSLSLAERYVQGLGFGEFIGLAIKYRGSGDVRKAFSTVQVIKKK